MLPRGMRGSAPGRDRALLLKVACFWTESTLSSRCVLDIFIDSCFWFDKMLMLLDVRIRHMRNLLLLHIVLDKCEPRGKMPCSWCFFGRAIESLECFDMSTWSVTVWGPTPAYMSLCYNKFFSLAKADLSAQSHGSASVLRYAAGGHSRTELSCSTPEAS